ncbi:hypothetical protein [Variovorax sp. PCZ-1]|uniref:hypothetical protein n=1 Tax=Variovorax sp. PCZ-1 TaxID=2835533 RepID=UPI001BCC1274|nr:hypothetical protein [Variovorax sp. PCZ-1]MBS7808960.1 hypothetical protein [Variovorax sp. PCZ-1]
MISSRSISSTKLALACAAALILSACGGGGSDSSTTTYNPTQVTLASSAGDLNKYLGRWSTGCGFTFIAGSSAKSGLGGYQFATPVSATVIPGTVTVTLYSSTNCTGTPVSSGSNPMTTTFVSSTNPVATSNSRSSSVIFSGNADRLTIQEYNRTTGALVGTARTQYAAFSANFTELRIENTSTFSQFDSVLKK